MPRFSVAHLREQGQDIIIVPLDRSFGTKPESEKSALVNALQRCANQAGLAGTVVPVWDNGGRMAFIAPRGWHPFFTSINLSIVAASINKEITCG